MKYQRTVEFIGHIRKIQEQKSLAASREPPVKLRCDATFFGIAMIKQFTQLFKNTWTQKTLNT